jgi:anti-sigma regulatory factor (Ser/Thr protein kinase)
MREIALHILDIAENSVAAGAKAATISILENADNDQLLVTIQDNGKGIDKERIAEVVDPFITSRTDRKVGLGIPLFKAAAELCNGGFEIKSEPGNGTIVQAMFQLSHIDRMPLGDVSNTFLNLLVAHPEINWKFNYTRILNGEDERFEFDDAPVKEALEDVPLCEPEVLTYLVTIFHDGIKEKQALNHLTD